MCVIVDVILTITVVAAATGAIPELQLRIGHIGAAADGAFVGKILFFGSGALGGTELDRLCSFFGVLGLFDNTHLPGQQIPDILACKQQEIQKAYQREQIVGEDREIVDDRNGDERQIQKANQPSLYRNNKENQKLRVRIQNGEHQNHAQMQIQRHVRIKSGE